ncbi:adenylate/guanylate cyclase domain-containing protein [Vibrio scophthalmi]|uniref:hypothetical protein n=1 Tax=Vibrio scophthalmi TaxID=45658 RepID=UPI002FF2D7CA
MVVTEATSKERAVAVLTGDVIGSTELSPQEYEDLLYTLTELIQYVCRHHPHNEYEITRGDSFQVIIHDPENAAKYALIIRIGLKNRNIKYDCRSSIGIGFGASIRHNVGYSTGDAFTLSGRTLDAMDSETLKINTPDIRFNEHFDLLTKYVDFQVSGMKERQYAITYIMLTCNSDELTQGMIASKLGVHRVSVNRTINSANLTLIEKFSSLFSKKVKEYFL